MKRASLGAAPLSLTASQWRFGKGKTAIGSYTQGIMGFNLSQLKNNGNQRGGRQWNMLPLRFAGHVSELTRHPFTASAGIR